MIYLYLSNKGLESLIKSNWILFSNRKRSLKEDFTFKIFINNHLVERILNVRWALFWTADSRRSFQADHQKKKITN